MPLVPRSPAAGDTRNAFAVDQPQRFTHVRLCMHPDGGVARLRVHGEVVPGPRFLDTGDHRLVFATGDYFAATGRTGFHPEVAVTFTVAEDRHHHVPLLLSPYAFCTYRGS